MCRILVTGANGQLGSWMCNLAGEDDNFIFSDLLESQDLSAGRRSVRRYESLDITDAKGVDSLVRREDIKVIVNCAAYTNVDGAEDNYDLAEALNATAVRNLAESVKGVGGLLVHISTDYVFGGNKCNTPCTEETPANPTGIYGVTKLHGEDAVKASGCDYVIIRTSWLYSEYGKNFLKTMLDLTSDEALDARVAAGKTAGINVVIDQIGTPTYAKDLAKAILHIVEDYNQYLMKLADCSNMEPVAGYPKCGVYHFSNEGVTSWFDFARMIAALAGNNNCPITPCRSSEFPSKVVRPSYSVLDKSKIKQSFGVEIPYWRDSLERCICNLKK
ncbi:MAG: dTDP-4-dehydrorhamnose reductase [Bacteroidales bacterium]|nr:dTDP-4-dehydrorhamnose reductase [Bacteroidales bacterium]